MTILPENPIKCMVKKLRSAQWILCQMNDKIQASPPEALSAAEETRTRVAKVLISTGQKREHLVGHTSTAQYRVPQLSWHSPHSMEKDQSAGVDIWKSPLEMLTHCPSEYLSMLTFKTPPPEFYAHSSCIYTHIISHIYATISELVLLPQTSSPNYRETFASW